MDFEATGARFDWTPLTDLIWLDDSMALGVDRGWDTRSLVFDAVFLARSAYDTAILLFELG